MKLETTKFGASNYKARTIGIWHMFNMIIQLNKVTSIVFEWNLMHFHITKHS